MALTLLPQRFVNFLPLFLRHAERLGFLPQVAFVPQFPRTERSCERLIAKVAGPVLSPCLPFVSQFWAKSQFFYMQMVLQLGFPVLWFDFFVFWVESPLQWVHRALNSSLPRASYIRDCGRESRTEGSADMFSVRDFYQAYTIKLSLLLLRPTQAMREWLDVFLHWLCTFPFGDPSRGFRYLAFPLPPAQVPSVSMLPLREDVLPLKITELDSEQSFVSTDGWFGEIRRVRAFHLQPRLLLDDKVRLLRRLYSRDAELVISSARKPVSPMRPALRMSDRPKEGPQRCSWHRDAGVFLGGFAQGVNRSFDYQVGMMSSWVTVGAEQTVTRIWLHHECGATIARRSSL